MEKKIKEGIHLKKKKRFVKQKISGKIFVLMGLAIILAIAAYTFILQSAYTKTALETEISRDRASADAVHKLVDGKILDSFDLITLVAELGEEFDIEITAEDFVEKNFNSLDALTQMVDRLIDED